MFDSWAKIGMGSVVWPTCGALITYPIHKTNNMDASFIEINKTKNTSKTWLSKKKLSNELLIMFENDFKMVDKINEFDEANLLIYRWLLNFQ